jgi:MoaA/NifB/PqqE/SkfB family radical SAM enzyme
METTAVEGTNELRDTRFMWLEITGNCQLECGHCYADSGPGKGSGKLTADHWILILSEAALGGVRQVQFIGGEPTTHPALPRLIEHAVAVGLRVEVFSNLVSLRKQVWQALTLPGVSLATSYYSASSETHDRITGRVGSHGRTKSNIIEALRLGIPLRVGVVQILENQDVQSAMDDLLSVGVQPDAITFDDVRGVGRGRESRECTTENELCGRCANGVLAIMPDGRVQPCVFSRGERFEVGDLLQDDFSSVLVSDRLYGVRQHLSSVFLDRARTGLDCLPVEQPQNCGPACSPSCIPMGNCNPVVNPGPCNPQAGHPPRPEPPVRPPGPVCGPYDRCSP